MDQIDLSYIMDATIVHRSPKIANPIDEESAIKFTVLSEDPDKVNLVHIEEGLITVNKLIKESDDKTREVFFEATGMQGEEWKYTDGEELPIKMYKSNVNIKRVSGQHHSLHTSIKDALQSVLNYPGDDKRLIVTTDHDGREKGISVVISKLIVEAIKIK